MVCYRYWNSVDVFFFLSCNLTDFSCQDCQFFFQVFLNFMFVASSILEIFLYVIAFLSVFIFIWTDCLALIPNPCGIACFICLFLEDPMLHVDIDVCLLIIPLKKDIMFFTYITRFVCVCVCVCVCLCVCLSVCHHVCSEMAGLSNMVSSEVNTIYKNLKMQH